MGIAAARLHSPSQRDIRSSPAESRDRAQRGVLINLVVDLSYGLLDPKVRYRRMALVTDIPIVPARRERGGVAHFWFACSVKSRWRRLAA